MIIGAVENSQSYIRNGSYGEILAHVQTKGILNHQEFGNLWISWNTGLIQLGIGYKVGVDKVLEYQGDDMPVHGLGFSTGFGSAGEWEFNTIEGQVFFHFNAI